VYEGCMAAIEQMTSRMGARAQSGSRNMPVMAEIESSTPTSYSSPNACVTYFQPFGHKLLPVYTSSFQNLKSCFRGRTDVQIA